MQQPNKQHFRANQVTVLFLANNGPDFSDTCPISVKVFMTCMIIEMAEWPRGLRRYVQVVFRKGVGSNPTSVKCFAWDFCFYFLVFSPCSHRVFAEQFLESMNLLSDRDFRSYVQTGNIQPKTWVADASSRTRPRKELESDFIISGRIVSIHPSISHPGSS